ncbi:AAA family ATPase [Novosphingobium album (ex Liu et al. 2023)]|uniref:AAA family ATPase n=1 Tax=Novosphingobium album (ex Liu et al. 2023) TaxID=3031130 RepID=A0ABT5WVD7_9SPHN|nr:AAA family ATPase [Novosphingobium album (ex Liu et al. 2023)]MDE8653881.1 AAA family ATPase [Novosphingobium album (ex Liu et al. 2023)]
MLDIDRHNEPVPACLSDSRSAHARDALRSAFATTIEISSQTRFSMKGLTIEDPELQASLERLFHGHCAFCERAVPTRPYRFRPTEEAGPTTDAHPDYGDRAHLYYTWLANSWDNIYPICGDCIPLEPSVFPVRGKRCPLPDRRDIELYAEQPTGTWRVATTDKPILLDPTGGEDFRKHLLVLPDGRMFGIDERGRFSVRHFNLDRPDAEASRRKALRSYFKRLANNSVKGTQGLFDFDQLLHGGSWFLLLYQLARKLGGGGGARPALSSKRIESFYRARMRRPNFDENLQAAHDALEEDLDALLNAEPDKAIAPSITAARPVQFKIENFKSIETLTVTLPSPPPPSNDTKTLKANALMILGENATGKSSILEAMALALTSDAARRGLAREASQFMLGPRFLGGKGPSRKGRVELTYEDGRTEIMRVEPSWPRSKRADAESPRIPVFAYGAFRFFLRADKRRLESTTILSLFDPAYVLPNPERWLASLFGKPQFTEVVRALRSILAVDQEFDVIAPDDDGEFCLAIATELPDGSTSSIQTPLIAVSSGFRAVLAMACDIMRSLLDLQGSHSPSLARARAIVLIDEVEAHLHPRWKMRIMSGLRQSLPNVTFIVTTHDPLCLRGMASNEVLALRRMRRRDPGPDALPEIVEPLRNLPAIDMLTVEQLLTSDLFDLFSTDAADMEESLAQAGDLLALEKAGPLKPEAATKLATLRAKLQHQIIHALPVGSTRVERLVQDAVESYLRKRRDTPSRGLQALNDATKASIVDALERL